MEKKINSGNKHLKQMDKPGFHRSEDNQHGLSASEKTQSKTPKKEPLKTGTLKVKK